MADLSAQLGNSVTPQAIYKYEAGKMLPGSPLLIELSRVLNVPADFFFRPFTVQVVCPSARQAAITMLAVPVTEASSRSI